MKIKLTLKDPDGVHESVGEIVEGIVNQIMSGAAGGLLDRDALAEQTREGIMKTLAPWVEYGEYITVEVDTEAKTAVVELVRR